MFDENTNMLSINYTDSDGNLPWYKAVQICNTIDNGGDCFVQLNNMIPDSRNYDMGVTFSITLEQDVIDQYSMNGEYVAKFWFADDDIDEYPNAQLELPINIGASCSLVGDSNQDGFLNVLDVVLLVGIILNGGDNSECSDVNGDGFLNVLDVVLLVNLILNP